MQTAAAAAIHTYQFVKGDAGVQIQCCVRQEESTAFRAVVHLSLSILFHLPTVDPLAGQRLPVRPRKGNSQQGSNLGRTVLTLAA